MYLRKMGIKGMIMDITKENRQKLKQLKKYVKMESEEDIRLFDLTVGELASTQDAKILKELIDVFDDDCEFPEVMYSMVHAIESYPDDIYVKTIASKVVDFLNYQEWFLDLIYPILNNRKCRQIFKENLHLAYKTKLLELLNIIEEESEEHHHIVKELKEQLAPQK